ncbi:hypothetical protein [Rubrivirga sp. IMCC43871]|uniref:hypothetical protein n=1 Tax=Rubrivirga sp. IMCC43871 TaxID=3391575 RepID=UPI0039900AC2
MPLSAARDAARADWLAGDANAWARYSACVRTLATLSPEARPTDPRRASRPTRTAPKARRRDQRS